MQKNVQKFTLTITYIKILETVFELNEKGFYPLPQGVYKIVSGKTDEETLDYKWIKTYGSLISFSSKKVSRFIMMLLRYEYLHKKYDPNTDELYLARAFLKKSSLFEYQRKHKINYSKKESNKRRTIVKIS